MKHAGEEVQFQLKHTDPFSYLRQIHRNIQVVVEKVGILFGVQELQQGRGGVALVTTADLIHLVKAGKRNLRKDSRYRTKRSICQLLAAGASVESD